MPVDHAKLTELFTHAVDLPRDEQALIIARVRADDPAMAAELAALLDHDDRIVTGLRTAGMKPDDLGDSFRKPTIPAGKLGIPGYTITGELGKGGMGVVYAADQWEPPMQVAVKVLHMAGAEALARFNAEADIMKQLDHPSIARVLATGEANGHPYMVMERIDGVLLDAFVKTRNPSLAKKLDLFAKLCDAVHYAHDEGVIHRDLKPANIMVRDDGSVAILDFGVARIGGSVRTQQGDFLGTLMYMSPEQATARINEIDKRTDIYSLGVILFELVRGQMPYDLRNINVAQAVRMIVSQAPKQLGSPDRELDAICAQALAKQKQHRQSSAAELARQIRGVVVPP
jgi:serine/threonine protein kinase